MKKVILLMLVALAAVACVALVGDANAPPDQTTVAVAPSAAIVVPALPELDAIAHHGAAPPLEARRSYVLNHADLTAASSNGSNWESEVQPAQAGAGPSAR